MSKSGKSTLLILLFTIGLLLQLGWYSLLLAQSFKETGHMRQLDFSIFYITGRITRESGMGEVYNLQRQVDAESHLVGRSLALNELLPFNHPPLLLALQALIAVDDYIQAYRLWLALQSVILLAVGFSAYRLLRRLGWERLPSACMSADFVLFYPLIVGLIKGQDTGLALLGLTVALAGLLLKDDRRTGLGLSLLVLRPQIALPLALPFLFKRRRVWWWFLGAAAALTIFSVLLVGRQGVQDFLKMLAVSANGEQVVIHGFDMYNLKGMLIRWFPAQELTVTPVITWVVYLFVLVALCVWWARSRDVEPYQFALAVILVLFVSPHLHYHDLAFLLAPILILCLELIRQGRSSPMSATLLVMGITYYLAVIQLTSFRFLGVYLLMILLAVLLWISNRGADLMQAAQEVV